MRQKKKDLPWPLFGIYPLRALDPRQYWPMVAPRAGKRSMYHTYTLQSPLVDEDIACMIAGEQGKCTSWSQKTQMTEGL